MLQTVTFTFPFSVPVAVLLFGVIKYISFLLFIADVFPFAFAIVDAENKENCRWFAKQLAMIMADDYRQIVFMSDRGAGFLETVKEVFPNSPHSYCIHHLKMNLNGWYISSVLLLVFLFNSFLLL